MRESRTYGFVRGAVGNDRPYRDSQPLSLGMSLGERSHRKTKIHRSDLESPTR